MTVDTSLAPGPLEAEAGTVVIIETGGTIASTSNGAAGATPTLGSDSLLGALPKRWKVRSRQVLSEDSSVLTLAQMQQIVDAAEEALCDPDAAGVVVMHGTDSMEETSFLAEIQHTDPRPIVFTGAQFTADSAEADGPWNLAHALDVAAAGSDQGHDPNVRIAFGGRLFRPSGAYKMRTDAADAFTQLPAVRRSPGFIGRVGGDERVDIIYLTPGADARHLEASIAAGVDGIILQALGSGNTTPEVVEAVRHATESGIPVIVTSRVPEGVLSPTYGGGGGGADLVRAGAVLSKGLRSSQARILLAALISRQATTDEIVQTFN